MTKSFKRSNPLDNLDNENTTVVPDETPIAAIKKTPDIEATKVESKSNKKTSKDDKKYLRLDITDYQEYISLMSEHLSKTSGKYISMTQYILKLIEADKKLNRKLFDKLEQIEQMKSELI